MVSRHHAGDVAAAARAPRFGEPAAEGELRGALRSEDVSAVYGLPFGKHSHSYRKFDPNFTVDLAMTIVISFVLASGLWLKPCCLMMSSGMKNYPSYIGDDHHPRTGQKSL